MKDNTQPLKVYCLVCGAEKSIEIEPLFLVNSIDFICCLVKLWSVNSTSSGLTSLKLKVKKKKVNRWT